MKKTFNRALYFCFLAVFFSVSCSKNEIGESLNSKKGNSEILDTNALQLNDAMKFAMGVTPIKGANSTLSTSDSKKRTIKDYYVVNDTSGAVVS